MDDTSNFEEFEIENNPPLAASLAALSSSDGFSGKDLPFVGFTYARSIVEGKNRLEHYFVNILELG